MIIKILVNSVLALILILIIFLVVMAIYHHAMLLVEEKKFKNIGTLVSINGSNMNVFIEGNKQADLIVLLSGSGVAAPIYDYKALYSKLTENYRIAVVEKSGYCYFRMWAQSSLL